jgi:hypothetical protein
MQDDIKCSAGCFAVATDLAADIIFDRYNLAILSLFQRSDKEISGEYTLLHVGHPCAQCWLVTRRFWNVFTSVSHNTGDGETFGINDQRRAHFVRDLCDYKICRFAQLHDFDVAIPKYSLVQHVGDVSSINGRDMSFHKATNFIEDVLDGKTKKD